MHTGDRTQNLGPQNSTSADPPHLHRAIICEFENAGQDRWWIGIKQCIPTLYKLTKDTEIHRAMKHVTGFWREIFSHHYILQKLPLNSPIANVVCFTRPLEVTLHRDLRNSRKTNLWVYFPWIEYTKSGKKLENDYTMYLIKNDLILQKNIFCISGNPLPTDTNNMAVNILFLGLIGG